MATLAGRIWNRICRYRSSRGFGIHSPFAFRFITDVLCQKNPYYGYAVIEKYAGSMGYHDIHSRDARLLFRIVNFFNPGKILLCGAPGDSLAEIAVKEVSEHINILRKPNVEQPANFLIMVGSTDKEKISGIASKMLSGNNILIFMNLRSDSEIRELWEQSRDNLRQGHTYTNNAVGVIVATPKLPLQHFLF